MEVGWFRVQGVFLVAWGKWVTRGFRGFRRFFFTTDGHGWTLEILVPIAIGKRVDFRFDLTRISRIPQIFFYHRWTRMDTVDFRLIIHSY